jgi:ethanolamine transporter EutH
MNPSQVVIDPVELRIRMLKRNMLFSALFSVVISGYLLWNANRMWIYAGFVAKIYLGAAILILVSLGFSLRR